MTPTSSTSTEALALEERIQVLTNLHNRFQSLRPLPSFAIRPQLGSVRGADFASLKEVEDLVRSERVQEALCAAKESEKKDRSELGSNFRRESRKRRRPPSPESPQPYVSFQPKTSSLFPVSEDDPAPLRIDQLPGFIRDFNQSNPSKLHIWSPRNQDAKQLCNPVILRFTIRDVLTAFVTLGFTDDDTVLVTQTATAFGPRERKSPHSQSDYIAYQNLSQQISHMIQSYPRVSFQSIMSLLRSYSGIFVDQCTLCQRVLSVEGHVPPVARLWIDATGPGAGAESSEGEKGFWQPRHTICLHSSSH
ncbi:hypothetical protein FIBSPDRAFT_771790 [Athelia psychrophila]|uniref:Uncharacterized protein n=1 Tax=Athelia psychrophila TaxID=1759441 RepID=A0A166X064_9AGAM|nr:hypothetical protein FIBSPDRAFT_771790 [Fibularhizoctonia sp. CBS 109695]